MDKKRDYSCNKIVRGLVLLIIYIVIFYYLIEYILHNTDMMIRIISMPKSLIAIGIITTTLAVILSAPLDIVCARVYGMKLDINGAVAFIFIASAINIVLPLQVGSAVKAVYYKKRMGLSYSKYLSIMSGTIIIHLMVTFLVLILSLLSMMVEWNVEKKYVTFVSIIFFIGLFVMFIIMRLKDKILNMLPFQTYTYPIMSGFFELFGDKKAMTLCVLIFVMKTIMGGIRCASIFICLGLPAGFVNGMLYYGLYCASSIVSILPGNIGISEILVGGMNMILGADFDAGVALVLANRIYYFIVVFAGAMVAAIPAWIMFKRENDIAGV